MLCTEEEEKKREEQNRTEQNRTEQNRTEQNRTEQNRTEEKTPLGVITGASRPRGSPSYAQTPVHNQKG